MSIRNEIKSQIVRAGFMSSDTNFSIPSIPNIRDGWADGMDVFKFTCEGGCNGKSLL